MTKGKLAQRQSRLPTLGEGVAFTQLLLAYRLSMCRGRANHNTTGNASHYSRAYTPACRHRVWYPVEIARREAEDWFIFSVHHFADC